jgi:hypothetical protein
MKAQGGKNPAGAGTGFLDFNRISRSMQYVIRLEFRICGIFDLLSINHLSMPSFTFGISSGWCQQALATRGDPVIYWTVMIMVTQWLVTVL